MAPTEVIGGKHVAYTAFWVETLKEETCHQREVLYNTLITYIDHFACGLRWLCVSWDNELHGYKRASDLAKQI